MTAFRSLLLSALMLALVAAPLVAQDSTDQPDKPDQPKPDAQQAPDGDEPEADPAKAELEAVAAAYQAARQARFAEGPAMDKLQQLADAFIAKWTGKAPATVVASARTYRVRCLLTAGKHEEILAETAALFAIEGLSDDDAYKLYYYRGMSAIEMDQKSVAEECVKGLTELKPDIGAALKGAMAEKWPLVVPGKLAPQWTLPRVRHGAVGGLDGELALESLRGKYVLLDFWATWCGPCKALMARELAPLHKEWAGDDRFELVSVGTNWSGDTSAKQAQFAHDNDYHWTKVYDLEGTVTADHGVRGIPTLTFIGPDGKVIIHGYAGEVMPVVKETLAKLAAERAPGPKPDSKPQEPRQPDREEEDF